MAESFQRNSAYSSFSTLKLGNCSNFQVAGFREMIREAGRDFREVIPI